MAPKPKDASKRRKGSDNSKKNQDGTTLSQNVNNGDDKCKQCSKIFINEGDKLVECERCEGWECQSCSKMSDLEYQALSQSGSRMHWFCQSCNEEAISAVKTSQLIETKCRQYVREMKEELLEHIEEKIDKELDSTRLELQQVKEEICGVKHQIANQDMQAARIIEEKMADTAQMNVSEIQERNARRNNLVIFNIPESNKVEPDDVKREDSKQVEDILQRIDAPCDFNVLMRVGKKGDAPRPVKIRIKEEADRTNILKSAKKLKGSVIFINKDMTPLERAEHRKLVTERKRRQEQSDTQGLEAHWIIRRGQVVNVMRSERSQRAAVDKPQEEPPQENPPQEV